ncbi:Similar to Gpkow: G-patch domain and KOW motifs-containing protein (Mus musculus) [Cotesia congregata]|uniref:Similar to Gpkow: G-patch domain and KOW motifs-containing protein (Mus musculus) n=1 Tax=Cotesia congregata TaxID=51543 RepID=A0A8J2MEX0_COTCN|nr:Similar to Gpkow: G-patch domain and KOW motifs-containing protein (Mus musculus) [Cotesia congregata]
MTQENKKISFGFSRQSSRQPLLKAPTEAKVKDGKDYIKCIDNKSIKLINETKVVNGPLVIPLIESSNSWKNKLIEKLNSKDVNTSSESSKKLNSTEASSKNFNSTSENSNSPAPVLKNSVAASDNLKSSSSKEEIEIIDVEKIEKVVEVIEIEENDEEEMEISNVSKLNKVEIDEKEWDRLAAEEILKDSQKKIKVEKGSDFKIEISESNMLFVGEEESTLDDYERIPIDQFGMAMLRGMGWHPDRGIGKKPQLVTTEVPLSRPRGMGLGADKVVKKPSSSGDSKKELKLEKGCFVKLIAGRLMGHYGEVKGFDEDKGRVMVKLSLLDDVQTFSEVMLDPVSKDEFDKNSKVINISKYEEYKNKTQDLEDGRSRVNGHVERERDDDRRDVSYSSRDKRRDRERSRSKERSRGGKNKYERRDRDRSRSRGRENKHERRDRGRDRSGERHKHKKSKHHKKHRH